MAFACHFHVLDDCLQKIMIGITYKYTLVFTFAFDNVVAPHRGDLELMGFQKLFVVPDHNFQLVFTEK